MFTLELRIADYLRNVKSTRNNSVDCQFEETVEIRLSLADPMNGIIAQLNRSCLGAWGAKNLVTVTGISHEQCGRNFVDVNDNLYFVSRDYPEESWLCLDFKSRRIFPSAYSIVAPYLLV